MDDASREKQQFCELVKRRIRAAGLSLTEVDRRAGWNPGYLSQILNGYNSFRVEHLFAIARILGVPVQQLFTAPEPAVVEPPDDLLPGGVTLSGFRELLQQEVDKAVAARLPPEESPEKEKAEDPD